MIDFFLNETQREEISEYFNFFVGEYSECDPDDAHKLFPQDARHQFLTEGSCVIEITAAESWSGYAMTFEVDASHVSWKELELSDLTALCLEANWYCASVRGDLRDTLEAEAGLDWSSLLTFGGDEPPCTSNVWSWDENAIMVGACAPFEVVRRSGASSAQTEAGVA